MSLIDLIIWTKTAKITFCFAWWVDKRLRYELQGGPEVEEKNQKCNYRILMQPYVLCNQQGFVVYSDFYRQPMEGYENREKDLVWLCVCYLACVKMQ